MKKIFLMITCIIFSITMIGCVNKDYGYNFHFYVVEGEGELTIKTTDSFNPSIKHCKDFEDMCELGCDDNSYFISLRGGKIGSHELTFIAMPEDGYQVKEWIFNGKIVEGNNTNTFTAKVTNEDHYNGVIAVKFEII